MKILHLHTLIHSVISSFLLNYVSTFLGEGNRLAFDKEQFRKVKITLGFVSEIAGSNLHFDRKFLAELSYNPPTKKSQNYRDASIASEGLKHERRPITFSGKLRVKLHDPVFLRDRTHVNGSAN